MLDDQKINAARRIVDALREVLQEELDSGVPCDVIYQVLDVLVANVVTSIVDPKFWPDAQHNHSDNVNTLIEAFELIHGPHTSGIQ